jgi:hypothetical protein
MPTKRRETSQNSARGHQPFASSGLNGGVPQPVNLPNGIPSVINGVGDAPSGAVLNGVGNLKRGGGASFVGSVGSHVSTPRMTSNASGTQNGSGV